MPWSGVESIEIPTLAFFFSDLIIWDVNVRVRVRVFVDVWSDVMVLVI